MTLYHIISLKGSTIDHCSTKDDMAVMIWSLDHSGAQAEFQVG